MNSHTQDTPTDIYPDPWLTESRGASRHEKVSNEIYELGMSLHSCLRRLEKRLARQRFMTAALLVGVVVLLGLNLWGAR